MFSSSASLASSSSLMPPPSSASAHASREDQLDASDLQDDGGIITVVLEAETGSLWTHPSHLPRLLSLCVPHLESIAIQLEASFQSTLASWSLPEEKRKSVSLESPFITELEYQLTLKVISLLKSHITALTDWGSDLCKKSATSAWATSGSPPGLDLTSLSLTSVLSPSSATDVLSLASPPPVSLCSPPSYNSNLMHLSSSRLLPLQLPTVGKPFIKLNSQHFSEGLHDFFMKNFISTQVCFLSVYLTSLSSSCHFPFPPSVFLLSS